MTENQAAAGRYFRALRGLRQIRKGKVLFMEGHGFIRDMLDVKLLILFVASKAAYPMSLQKIYELCFQDDRLSYFDLSVAVPQMVDSGHLAEIEKDRFVITQKGEKQRPLPRTASPTPSCSGQKQPWNALTRRKRSISSSTRRSCRRMGATTRSCWS